MSYRRRVDYEDDSDSFDESAVATSFGQSISSTRTASNNAGPGRVVGNLFSVAGRRLEKSIGRFAHKAGVGPVVRVEQRIDSFSKTLFLSESDREEVCFTLLEFAANRVPSVQLRAFRKITELILEDPSLARSLQDAFHQRSRGELMEDGVRSWQRGGKIYDDEWIRIYRRTKSFLTRDLDKVPEASRQIQKRLNATKELILAEQLTDLEQCSTLISCAESSSPGVQLLAFRCIVQLQMERATGGFKHVLQQFGELHGKSAGEITRSWRRNTTIYSRQWTFLYGLVYDSLAREDSGTVLERYRKQVRGFVWPPKELGPTGFALKRLKIRLSHVLDCAWLPDPVIQLEVYHAIVETLTAEPSSFLVFVECLEQHGESVETVTATWRQNEETSGDLVLYSNLASACVSKNNTTDAARSVCRRTSNMVLHDEAACNRRCHPAVFRLVECCRYDGYEGYVAMRIIGSFSYNLLVHVVNDTSQRTTLYRTLPDLILERLGASSGAPCEDLGGICMLANRFLDIMWDDDDQQMSSDVSLWKKIFKIVEKIRSLISDGREWLKDESSYASKDWKTCLLREGPGGRPRSSRFLAEVLELAPAGTHSSRSRSPDFEDEERDDRDSFISYTNTEERSDFDPSIRYDRDNDREFNSDVSDDRLSDRLGRDLYANDSEEDY